MKKFVPRKCFDFKQIHGCFWPYFYSQIKDAPILSAVNKWEWLVNEKYAIQIDEVEDNTDAYKKYLDFISIVRAISPNAFKHLLPKPVSSDIGQFNRLCEMDYKGNAESVAYQTLLIISEWKRIRSWFSEYSGYSSFLYYDELTGGNIKLPRSCFYPTLKLDKDNKVINLIEGIIAMEPFDMEVSRFYESDHTGSYFNISNLQWEVLNVIKGELGDFTHTMQYESEVIPELRFLLKLFTYSCCAEEEIKKLLTDNTFPRVLQMLREEIYEETFIQLNNSELGNKYCEFIDVEGIPTGVVRFANYMGAHYEEFSEQDENAFFYQLDKMRCIVSILSGEIKDIVGKDYEYPDGYFEEEKAVSKTIKTDERTNGRFDGFVVCHSQQSNILEVLHQFFDHKKGKNLALYVECAIEAGLITKPSFADLQAEFSIEGSKNAFNNYLQKGRFCDQEKAPVIAQMKKFG